MPGEDVNRIKFKIWPLALKIVLIYMIYGLAWIFFSDKLIEILIPNPNSLQTDLQTVKEFLFVNITALILYGFLYQNILKLRNSEYKALQSEHKWRSVIEHAPAIIMTLDESGNILHTNQNYIKIPQSKKSKKSIFDFIPKEFQKECRKNIQEVFEKRKIKTSELMLEFQRDEKMWYEMRMAPISAEYGVGCVITFSSNITNRKKAETEFLMLAHSIKSISECVVITDMTDNIVFTNDAFLKTYGYEEHELIGNSIEIVRSNSNSPVLENEILLSTLRGGWQGELLNRRKDGTEFPIFLSTSVVSNENGDPLALIGVAKDITESKYLEEQLRQAQKLHSLGTLAGGIAHDFNNLLCIIMGYASHFKNGKITAKKLAWSAESILKAVNRGSGLVQQILTFARKSEVLFETLKVNAIIRELVMFSEGTFPKTVNISIDLQEDLPFIKADQSQIHQTLLNFLLNARDALPGGGNILIKTHSISGTKLRKKIPDAAEEDYVCITLADDGVGMDSETISRIFEPFFTTKKRGHGTGLGLAVAYGVISSHQGFIDVYSKLSKGSTFYIYLPIMEESIESIEKIEERKVKVEGGSETILVVEDEEMLLNLVEDHLKQNGYRVVTAYDGEEAVDKYVHNSDKIALVLMDMGLPKLDGWSAYLKMQKHNPDAKIILASGYLDPEIKTRLLEKDFKNFIQKPYKMSEILRNVREAIGYNPN
jgi:PAS domain S-box-containing protein